ncbi:DUF402 domain-containing protein [Nocardioides flavescens]|uniref:DUF402 domain-containing protein n=1 Tax=Nocardioides flavescens TaxID=2691959 RepID=A0A6L7F439_9ACTN|nr:DUF402 domain-containing protein [Nocardioides flavescens]
MPVDLPLGAPVRLATTKWGERPHWEMPALHLGSDEHGDWIGFPTGTLMARPGASFVSTNDQVTLLPDAPCVATFHGPGGIVWTYVDMTTVPRWDGSVVRAVDLDLDVIERLDRTVFVDDEDEFEEHQVAFGYPPEVVDLARRSCDEVLSAVTSRVPPYDGTTAQRWLDVLAAVTR